MAKHPHARLRCVIDIGVDGTRHHATARAPFARRCKNFCEGNDRLACDTTSASRQVLPEKIFGGFGGLLCDFGDRDDSGDGRERAVQSSAGSRAIRGRGHRDFFRDRTRNARAPLTASSRRSNMTASPMRRSLNAVPSRESLR